MYNGHNFTWKEFIPSVAPSLVEACSWDLGCKWLTDPWWKLQVEPTHTDRSQFQFVKDEQWPQHGYHCVVTLAELLLLATTITTATEWFLIHFQHFQTKALLSELFHSSLFLLVGSSSSTLFHVYMSQFNISFTFSTSMNIWNCLQLLCLESFSSELRHRAKEEASHL